MTMRNELGPDINLQVVAGVQNGNGSGKNKVDDVESLFDPSRLRISQNFADQVGVKKVLLTIPVRKPHRQEFIRVHPNPSYYLDTLVLELKEDREIYLLEPNLSPELPGEVTAVTLLTCMTRQAVLFLWPVRLPDPSGKRNAWSESARKGAELARDHWIRLTSNMQLGAYETFLAAADLPDPEWPTESFQELLKVAFNDRFIRSTEHPVIRRLRGAA
jgi:hypothetical protein